jgi:hypothetical protein
MKLYKIKFRFGAYAFHGPSLCSSTDFPHKLEFFADFSVRVRVYQLFRWVAIVQSLRLFIKDKKRSSKAVIDEGGARSAPLCMLIRLKRRVRAGIGARSAAKTHYFCRNGQSIL